LFVTLLALALALVFVATLAEDADARRVRHKKSTAAFVDTFTPPDRFTCRYLDGGVPLDQSLDGYRCTAGTTTFLLDDVLTRGGNPPLPGSEDPLAGVAIPPPALFKCHFDRNAAGDRSAEHFICQSRQNQQTFKVNEIVSTTLDEDDDVTGDTLEEDVDGEGDVWLPPGPDTTTPTPTPKPTATKTPASVPTAVPAGTDAAGEGSAAGLIGLVLAAGGAVVGGAVMARRRFMHDS
jgi:hypothetical protein